MQPDKIYQLLISVLTDQATEEEEKFLKNWLELSEDNKAEYERIVSLYTASKPPPSKIDVNIDRAWENVYKETIGKKKKNHLYLWMRYVAILTIIISVGFYFLFTPVDRNPSQLLTIDDVDQPTLLLETGEQIALNKESFSRQQKEILINNEVNDKLIYKKEAEKEKNKITNNSLIVPHGKTYKLVLSDGTRVWLNSKSKLTYPTSFAEDKREVELIGEAFFEVSHDKEKPFMVKTDDMIVKVLGTSFNVSSYQDDKEANITLVTGLVSVQTTNNNSQTINPSEKFSYNKESGSVSIQPVDTQLFISWIDGVYIFKDDTLEEIILKLQRWYDFTISYEDESLKQKRFRFTADRETGIDKLLEVISFASGIKLEKKENCITFKK